ncbi:MAG TPA: APC family permease [Candidatus Dormibacteraeota bacterium]|jgi:APA family basic amino acid/polyamine antiporter|nr:APC family permease [Candidatus Dormibacteraeota bacterium]
MFYNSPSTKSNLMSHLARKLRLTDYFTLAWGTMIGVGWLVVMDDWLLRGGALGALLGFAIGGALLFPIGWVYGRLVAAMPDAAGEIAYTAAAFSRPISFSTGWMMMLAYFIVCPWEAVAVGRIAGYIIPSLDSFEIYRIAGRPVYLPHLIIGLGLTALLTTLNYRGIRLSATFQNWTSFGTLALFIVFVALGASKGSPHNFPPLFTHAPLVSFLLVVQIVPYFMAGFESVGKAAEESTPEFRSQSFLKAIWMAILVAILFYAVVIAAVAFVAPWHELTGEKFMTAVAFQRAVGSRWIVSVILVAALLSLLKCFNGNFVAASRMVFALGRRGLVEPRVGQIHAQHQTPSAAVLCIGLATAVCMLLGDAILVPITEVGSVACAIGWAATCAAYLYMGRAGKLPGHSKLSPVEWFVAVFGLLVALAMLLMKVVPAIPGHFTIYEWIALGIWIVLGAISHRRAPAA